MKVAALSAYKQFHDLYQANDKDLAKLGFTCWFNEINEFNNRYRLARSFEGLKLKDYTKKTAQGYNAFLRVFLTHSTLEKFIDILNFKSPGALGLVFEAYQPQIIIDGFVKGDSNRLLYGFLIRKLDNKKLIKHLEEIYNGNEHNPALLSAAIRHTFAHGHLTANANGIAPSRVKKLCDPLSTFLLDFMDVEFSKKINQAQWMLESRQQE